ncbi:EamA family transporter [Candidatus Micrarchaeota archaeon]|nr:EamA family transporter [Candidatus Micrarchaeota archaeon]MBI5176622.1 EamA family transporter [Candidatus Micrarchaeota archaeon]
MAFESWLAYALVAVALFSIGNVLLKMLVAQEKALSPSIATANPGLTLFFLAVAAAGFLLTLKSLEGGKVALVTAVLSLSTVGVAILSMIFLGDRFANREIIAMLLAVASIAALVM